MSSSAADDDNGDPDEIALYAEYKDKLRTLRASQAAQMRIPSERVKPEVALAIHRSPNGSLVASASADAPSIKAETIVKADTTVKADLAASPAGAGTIDVAEKPPGFDDLDPYTQAAVVALQSRAEKRKVDAKEKAKDRAAGKKQQNV